MHHRYRPSRFAADSSREPGHAESRCCSFRARKRRARSWAIAAVVFLVGAVASLSWVLAQGIAAGTEGLDPFVVFGTLLIVGAAFAKGGETFYRRQRQLRSGPTPAPDAPFLIRKGVYITVTAPFWVLDTGATMIAGFGDLLGPRSGLVLDPATRIDLAAKSGAAFFNLFTDATTAAWIPEISLAVDPLIIDLDDKGRLAEKVLGTNFTPPSDVVPQMMASYGRMLTALQSGQLTVEVTPFPRILAVGSEVALSSSAKFTGKLDRTVVAHADLQPRRTAPLEILLPTSSSFRVLLAVPNRGADEFGKVVESTVTSTPEGAATPTPVEHSYGVLMTGVVRVVQYNVTLLGGKVDPKTGMPAGADEDMARAHVWNAAKEQSEREIANYFQRRS